MLTVAVFVTGILSRSSEKEMRIRIGSKNCTALTNKPIALPAAATVGYRAGCRHSNVFGRYLLGSLYETGNIRNSHFYVCI